MYRKIIIVGLILINIFMISNVIFVKHDDRAKETLSRYGSTGNEVTRIQTKLRDWGYYKGNIDGVFGSKTLEAVKSFQRKNGLTADGVVGEDTLKAMGMASSGGSGGSDNNVNLLARVIHGEARGEPYAGMVAVGAVIMNRIKNANFPDTIAGVVYQGGAFDAVEDGQVNLEPSQQAYRAARDAINGWDPTGGAIYYFNPNTATNKWIWSRPLTTVIGKHRFCK